MAPKPMQIYNHVTYYVGEILDKVQLGVMLTEQYNRQILIFIDVVLNASLFLSVTSNRFEISSFFVILLAVSIMMSQVGHNVHNVTHIMLLIIAKKAQLIGHCTMIVQPRDLVRRSISFHTLVKIYTLSTLCGLCDCFYECFASHITRPPSKYDVRLNNTA